MTKVKIKADRVFTNFLRANLTDINVSRTGQWIYPDFPRVQDLGDNSFPRIGITILSDNSDMMGLSDDTQYHTILLQIDCVTKKDLSHTRTIIDEALGVMGSGINSDRVTFDYPPNSLVNIKHNGVGYSNISIVNTDSDFSSPAAMSSGDVEVSFSTGNVNFNSTDVAGDDGESLTTSYSIGMEGKKQVEYLTQEVIKLIRVNWRSDTDLRGIHDLKMLNNSSIPIDEELGLFRQTIEYQVKMFNVGEGL